jgi:hypothetical protein
MKTSKFCEERHCVGFVLRAIAAILASIGRSNRIGRTADSFRRFRLQEVLRGVGLLFQTWRYLVLKITEKKC